MIKYERIFLFEIFDSKIRVLLLFISTEYGRLYRKIGVTQPHLELGTNLHSFYENYNQGVDIADVEEVLCLDEDYA